MNVLFLSPYPENGKSNLSGKFSSQIKCTSNLGHCVFYTSYDAKNIYINKYGDQRYKKGIGKNSFIAKNIVIMHNTMKAIKKWIVTTNIDLVYIRSTTATFAYENAFQSIHSTGAYMVIEIPTYPGNLEAQNSNRKIFYFFVHIMQYLYNSVYDKYASLYALIGEKANSFHGIPAINIENGIDINLFPQKKKFTTHIDEVHLLIVAMISYWHGYDRLIYGLIEYYKKRGNKKINVYVHVCGKSYDGSLKKLLDIASDNGIEDKIICHGFLSGDALNNMYNECDIAVGSLGLFRQNITVDTSLKLSEYTARGIPFIYCTESRNVDINAEYCLRLSEDETPVDINKVLMFYNMLDKDNVSKKMRCYAEQHLNWSKQIEKVINKICEIHKNARF